jgi:hypothetical protein
VLVGFPKFGFKQNDDSKTLKTTGALKCAQSILVLFPESFVNWGTKNFHRPENVAEELFVQFCVSRIFQRSLVMEWK